MSGKKKHILIIEGESAHAELIQRVFESETQQYRLSIAHSIDQARQFLSRQSPDMVLVNYRLPDGKATELYSDHLAQQRYPVIMLTNQADEKTAVSVIKAGIIDYVVKSQSTIMRLPEIVESALREWQHISQVKDAERALRDSERRLVQIVDFLPDPTFVIDAKGKVLHWNRAMAALTGVDADQMIGKGDFEYSIAFYGRRRPLLIDLIRESHQEIEKDYIVLKREKDRLYSESFHPELKPGGIHLSATASPLYDTEGHVIGAIESLRDITDQKKASEDLRQSEQRYRDFVELSAEGIWLLEFDEPIPLDLDAEEQVRRIQYQGYITECNDALARFYGYSKREDMIGKRLIDLYGGTPSDVNTRSTLELVKSGYKANDRETSEVNDQGEIVYFLNNAIGIIREENLTAIWGTQRDITEQKRINEELRLSEEKLSTVFQASPDSIVITRLSDNTIWDVNEGFTKTIGYTRDEALGRSTTELNIWVDPLERESLVRQMVDQGRIENREFHFRTKTGEIRVGLMSGEVIQIENEPYLLGITRDITERTLAENALKESEERFRQIAENIKGVFWLYDWINKKVLYVSPAYESIWGRSIKNLYERYEEWGESIHPDDLEHAGKTFNRILETGGGEPREYRIVRPDGTIRWISDIGYAVKNEEGTVVRITGIAEDITESKKAERALRLSELRYRSLIEQASFGISIFRPDGSLSFANEAMRKLHNLSQQEHDDLIDKYNILKDKQLKDNVLIREAFAGEAVSLPIIRYDLRDTIIGKKLNRQYIWIESFVFPIKDDQGKVREVVLIHNDTTDRKVAEELLNSEKERLAVTLRSIGDAVITTDRSGSIALMNPIAERLTGWSEGDAQGMPLQKVFRIINEHTRQPCDNPVEQVIESGEIIDLANNTVLISKNGKEYIISDSGAPIFDSEHTIIGVVLVFRDITEKRQMESELLKVEKLESLGVLAGGIAHDFNNFLTGILGNLSLAKLDVPSSSSLHQQLVKLEKASLQAKALTQQLLTFSKGGEPVAGVADLKPLVKDAASFALRGSNVRCDISFQKGLPFCLIDEGQIVQVIQNLIINADQAMPDGGIIKIRGETVTLYDNNMFSLAKGDYLRLILMDQGTGIKEEYLKKIFDPYFSTKQQGSGLGLAVAHSIIDKHNGCITVDSELGVGTTFTLYLPATTEGQKEKDSDTNQLAHGDGEKILVMDDEDYIRDIALHMLKRIGYTVELAKDGQEAIHMYRRALSHGKPFHAVILDLTVPGGLGGKETLEQLLVLDKNVKAIVTSGHSNVPIISNFASFGFVAAIKKPFLIEDISDTLQRILKGP